MGVKAEKSIREDGSGRDGFLQDSATLDKAEGAKADSPLPVEDDIETLLHIFDQEDVSRQVEVSNIFDSIFGRVGCYNCGLVGLDVKMRPEDIMQFDAYGTQDAAPGAHPVSYDS